MSEQNKAMLAHMWASIRQAAQPRELAPGIFAGDTTTTLAAGLMDLCARVEALEATQHAHADISRLSVEEREQFYRELTQQPGTVTTAEVAPIVVPNSSASLTSYPTGSLVKRLAILLARPGQQTWDDMASDVLWEVAAWIRSELNGRLVADRLEQEANR